ncbi:uncharacterized protein [Rutidosis leptorrhynchoides]|uniref:uncharacterized protein n=1 Tax=Rutidosis leptorrhynchoides TaxID=125765 RepID=UPI003A9A0DCD
MKVLSLNIRGFGSGKDSIIGEFKRLVFREHPDVVVLQETKWIWIGRDVESIIVNVDGPHEDTNKIKNVGKSFLSDHDVAWILGDDFNEVQDESERQNCIFMDMRASWFNEFINKSCLLDIALGGKCFTRICDNGLKISKLDRFLVYEKSTLAWGNLTTLALKRELSTLILRDKEIDFCPNTTKIFDEWLDADGGSLDCIFRNKLKSVKFALKEWGSKNLGKLEEEINDLKNSATNWELILESRNLNDSERETWLNIRKKWIEKEKIKTNMAKQKSRVKWNLEGDENIKYFHTIIKRRYSKCNIRGLNIEGSWCKDRATIEAEAFSHFQKWFSKLQTSSMCFKSAPDQCAILPNQAVLFD